MPSSKIFFWNAIHYAVLCHVHKSQFMSTLSHKLRAPNRVIQTIYRHLNYQNLARKETITLISIEKSPCMINVSRTHEKLSLESQEQLQLRTKGLGRRKTKKNWFEMNHRTSTRNSTESLSCSMTINSERCDSNFSITTYPLTLAAPYNGYRP
jgi:hypothetical protein